MSQMHQPAVTFSSLSNHACLEMVFLFSLYPPLCNNSRCLSSLKAPAQITALNSSHHIIMSLFFWTIGSIRPSRPHISTLGVLIPALESTANSAPLCQSLRNKSIMRITIIKQILPWHIVCLRSRLKIREVVASRQTSHIKYFGEPELIFRWVQHESLPAAQSSPLTTELEACQRFCQ